MLDFRNFVLGLIDVFIVNKNWLDPISEKFGQSVCLSVCFQCILLLICKFSAFLRLKILAKNSLWPHKELNWFLEFICQLSLH